MPGGPSPARDPCDDAAIEPANGAPKKGLAYRRASAGLGRLRREPDPCVRRRSGAGTHSARGCMGPAEFGNAGLSPWKTLSWLSRIRRRLGRALLPGDLGGAVGAAAPDLWNGRHADHFPPGPPWSIAEATAKIGQSGERPAPLPMRRKKRRERRSFHLANP